MSDQSDDTYRSLIDPPADSVTLRDADEVEGDDGMMEIRMPIASTGEVRNEGDEPLTADELQGMARQVDGLTRGVFPEHGGGNFVSAGKYSQFEKLGYWSEGEVAREAADDGEDLLMATARMPDPETLPAATGDYREALAILKEQAKRGIPIASSIGWREDDSAPGGNDLMEASIVGIGADPRTTTEGGTEALARAAVEAGADAEEFVAEVARAVDVDAKVGSDTDTDNTHDMSDDDSTGEDAGENRDEQNADDAAEFREFMREQTETQTEILRTLADSLREDGEDDDDDEEEEEEEDDDDESEQSADTEESESGDTDTEQSADDDDLAERVAELEETLQAVRNGEVDVETPETETDDEQNADVSDDADTEGEPDERETADPTGGLGSYR